MTPELNFVNSIHVYEWSQDVADQLEIEMKKIEAGLIDVLEMFEKSLSNSLQKEILEEESSSVRNSLLSITDRIVSILERLTRAGETMVKENYQLRKQLKDQQVLLEEFEMERDVLLQQVHAYLEANSSLRVRLEEQRCQTGSLQKQLNADLESQVKSLEKDKEKLSVLNIEKDKQIHKMTVMLEETAECLKNRETEVLNWKNKKDNLVSLLKADLQEVLGEKAKVEQKYVNLKERLENCFFKNNEGGKNSSLKRSLSMGDFNWINLHFLEKNITSEQSQDICANDLCCRQFRKVGRWDGENARHLKNQDVNKPSHNAACYFHEGILQELLTFNNTAEGESRQSGAFLPNPWRLRVTRSWLNGMTISPQTTHDRLKSPPVQAQLNALRCDLLNVAKKLEALKFQLISSGVIPEISKPLESRISLKRKANAVEEEEEEPKGGVSEEQKSEFKNLKNILQDAKNLNAKLQNLREEKQKMIDLNNRKEAEVEENEKKNEEFSQTAHEEGPPVGNHSCKTR